MDEKHHKLKSFSGRFQIFSKAVRGWQWEDVDIFKRFELNFICQQFGFRYSKFDGKFLSSTYWEFKRFNCPKNIAKSLFDCEVVMHEIFQYLLFF